MNGDEIQRLTFVDGEIKTLEGELLSMNENLSKMVKEGPQEEEHFDIPEYLTLGDQQTDSQQEPDRSVIEIVSLSDWFDDNVENFPNITKPTITVRGVDPSEQLIITIPEGPSDTEKRRLIVFDDANALPVLNIPAMDMRVYNNGFRIIYDYGSRLFIKSYGIRTGLISVFCHDINDLLIPYSIVKSKKKPTEVQVPVEDPSRVEAKLAEALDCEALQIRYKQSSKAEGLQTNFDAVKWLLERQGSIEDINHHLQIDNVIIDTLA
jgi:hypothetical protein